MPVETHRIGVTVSDPKHEMASKRNEKILKHIRVKADSRDQAMEKAKAHYKKQGLKVHDAYHHSVVTESSCDETAKNGKISYKQFKEKMSKYSKCDEDEAYEELKGNQRKLDKNKNGKLDAHDFKLLRKEDTELDESTDEIHADIHKALKKHVAEYNRGGGAESFGNKVVKTQKMIADKHKIDHKEAIRRVNAYVDSHVKD